MWHFAEWQRKGMWQDEKAWKGLIGLLKHEDVVREVLSEAGKKGGAITGQLYKENGLSEAHKKAIGDAGRGRTLTEEDKANKSAASFKRWAKPEARDFVKARQKVWDDRLAPYDLSDINERERAANDFGVTTTCIRQHAKRMGVHIVWKRR